jgi:hypothetical protein
MNTFKNLSLLFIGLIITMASCNVQVHNFRQNYTDTNALLHNAKNTTTNIYLKAHLKNGDVCVLRNSWQIDSITNTVTGSGLRYNYKRKETYKGEMALPIDSVSIFETNDNLKRPESNIILAKTVLLTVNALATALCLVHPKACFGSCPTFYMNGEDNFHYANAEGFSNAILPSLEYSDIDALNNSYIKCNNFTLTMKNEALETHCVNDVKLLAYPRRDGERVYQTPKNEFYVCENQYPLTKAETINGEETTVLKDEDKVERFSPADESNLSSKEEIIITFDNVKNNKDLGLILNFRQSLMTTYFIYGALGYMGDEVSDVFAKLEKNKDLYSKMDGGLKKELGNIDIYAWDESKRNWKLQNGFYETGPIAFNKQFIPIKGTFEKTVKLKIVLNKGLWKIDQVMLTNIKEKVEPLEIHPHLIIKEGRIDNKSLATIKDPSKHMISMPGNEFEFHFELPEGSIDYELFLFSKGYYIEYMREEWLKEKNHGKLRDLVLFPKKYLKDEAKSYKEYEKTMEEAFWNSKIDTKTFDHYEN